MSALVFGPRCGKIGAQVPAASVDKDLLASGFMVGSAISFAYGVYQAVTGSGAVTIYAGAPLLIWAGAVIGGLGTLYIIGYFYHATCAEAEGERACVAGAVDALYPAEYSAAQKAFPFTVMHAHLDLVAASLYYPYLFINVVYVKCKDDRFPVLRVMYHTEWVCAVALGSVIGGAVGAAVGIPLGVVAGVAVAVALGCAATLFVGCLFALIMGALVAAAVAAACVLIGSGIGGAIAKEVSSDEGPLADTAGRSLGRGDILSVVGDLVGSTQFDPHPARVMRFEVSTTAHGTIALSVLDSADALARINEKTTQAKACSGFPKPVTTVDTTGTTGTPPDNKKLPEIR